MDTITPHFPWNGQDEIRCPRTGLARPTDHFFKHMHFLEVLRGYHYSHWQSGLLVTSGWRDPVYNEIAGGAPDSQHILDPEEGYDDRFATDVTIFVPPQFRREAFEQLAAWAEQLGFTGIGLYDNHLHLDRRDVGPARWDERTPLKKKKKKK